MKIDILSYFVNLFHNKCIFYIHIWYHFNREALLNTLVCITIDLFSIASYEDCISMWNTFHLGKLSLPNSRINVIPLQSECHLLPVNRFKLVPGLGTPHPSGNMNLGSKYHVVSNCPYPTTSTFSQIGYIVYIKTLIYYVFL